MDTSDLKVALIIAQDSCRRAVKEAAWAKDALSESEEERETAETAQAQIEAGLLHISTALREIGED